MVRSAVKPQEIWIRKREIREDGLYLICRVRWDIQEDTYTDEESGETVTEYTYQEEEVAIKSEYEGGSPVTPATVDTEDKLQKFVRDNASRIIEKAQTKAKQRALV